MRTARGSTSSCHLEVRDANPDKVTAAWHPKGAGASHGSCDPVVARLICVPAAAIRCKAPPQRRHSWQGRQRGFCKLRGGQTSTVWKHTFWDIATVGMPNVATSRGASRATSIVSGRTSTLPSWRSSMRPASGSLRYAAYTWSAAMTAGARCENRTFSEFDIDTTGRDQNDAKYGHASSRANRLRGLGRQRPIASSGSCWRTCWRRRGRCPCVPKTRAALDAVPSNGHRAVREAVSSTSAPASR
jgi:hypothetical protein